MSISSDTRRFERVKSALRLGYKALNIWIWVASVYHLTSQFWGLLESFQTTQLQTAHYITLFLPDHTELTRLKSRLGENAPILKKLRAYLMKLLLHFTTNTINTDMTNTRTHLNHSFDVNNAHKMTIEVGFLPRSQRDCWEPCGGSNSVPWLQRFQSQRSVRFQKASINPILNITYHSHVFILHFLSIHPQIKLKHCSVSLLRS